MTGWEDRVVAPLNTATVFPFGSVHQVVAPNKVVQLKEGSVVLEKPFEGSTEVPFAVSRAGMAARKVLISRNASLRPVPSSLRPCALL